MKQEETLVFVQTVTSQMPKLDPPITLKDQRNELRLSYIQNVITPLPEYETKFSPVCEKKV